MIRLLHLATTLDIGGAEGQLFSVLSGLPKDRFDVTVAWIKGRGELAGEFKAAGVRAVGLGRPDVADPGVLGASFRLVRRLRPHVVHTHLMKADLVGALAARGAAVPALVSTKHNEDNYLRHLPVAVPARGVAQMADRVVVISEAVGRFVRRRLLLPRSRIHHIRYGYRPNGDGAADGDERAALRREFGVEPSAPVVVTIARLTAQKGLFDLLRAAAFVRDAVPEARFLIVGRGRLYPQLRKRMTELRLERSVRFLGFRKDVDRILAASDLMALPSHWEGFGMVLLEAMDFGVPVVGTAVGAIPEVVADGETGILVPPRDPDTLATAIVRILRNPDLAARMGRAARRRLRSEFSLGRAVDAHAELYGELLGRKGRP